ncbi:membrane protein [Staphylococcus aureus]|nr:membrane protein [Staphylococcus aureus]
MKLFIILGALNAMMAVGTGAFGAWFTRKNK